MNQVFEEHSETQYTRELLFSTVVELTSLVARGLRPSLHAAAQKMPNLPVSWRDAAPCAVCLASIPFRAIEA